MLVRKCKMEAEAGSPARTLQRHMTCKKVLRWIGKTWTAEELKQMLGEARRREPALRRLAHRNGSNTRTPADIPVGKKHLLVNAFASALYMVARGGVNDGAEYYRPMLDRSVHEAPERMAELPAVAAALKRWQEHV